MAIAIIGLFIGTGMTSALTDTNSIEEINCQTLNSEMCEILYPNGGEELWTLCEIEWEIYAYYPPLQLLSKISVGNVESGYITSTTGNHYQYTINTRDIPDGNYKAKLKVYLDSDCDGNPDCLFAEDESDDYFSIINGPYIPEKPSGPSAGRINISYSFSSSTIHHNENIPINFMFSWGDGTNTSWLGPYTSGEIVTADHVWDEFGTYIVKVQAKDSKNIKSDWSDGFMVSIYENPPSKPSIQGPNTGQSGYVYFYNISTVDPDGDEVFYLIDWYHNNVSGWLGPFPSGEQQSISHVFPQDGSYLIKVKSKDTYGEESDWSDPLQVSMPKNKAINTPFLSFLERHPYMFLLLQHLFNLQ